VTKLVKRVGWVVVLWVAFAPGAVRASESSVWVTGELSSMWQGYSVTLDGQQAPGQASNQPKQFVDVYPGRHEIVVDIWTSPFKSQRACQGFVDVPKSSEIRVKCAGGKLTVYGGTRLRDEDDAARDAQHDKRKRLRQALRDLIDDASDESRECRRAVVRPVKAVSDRIDGRRPDWRSALRKLRNAAEDAEDDCPRSIMRGFAAAREVLEDLADDE
jgi:hypothetical protein